jgi:hypothetical protein
MLIINTMYNSFFCTFWKRKFRPIWNLYTNYLLNRLTGILRFQVYLCVLVRNFLQALSRCKPICAAHTHSLCLIWLLVEHSLYHILHWLSIILGNVCHYITRAQRIHVTATHTHTHTQLMSFCRTTQFQPQCGSPTPIENKHVQTRLLLMSIPAERISVCMYCMAPAANRSFKFC